MPQAYRSIRSRVVIRRSSRLLPIREQRAALAVDRIELWQRDAGDGGGALLHAHRQRRAHVRVLPRRIGANDPQRAARRELLVPRARGQHDHVAGPSDDRDSVVPAELHRHFAAVDPERFVRIAVEMMKRVDAVAPRRRPPVAVEELLECHGRVRSRNCDRARVHEQRPARMIGDGAACRELMRDHAVGILRSRAHVLVLQASAYPDLQLPSFDRTAATGDIAGSQEFERPPDKERDMSGNAQMIIDLDRKRMTAMAQKDVAALRSMLCKGLVYTHSSARQDTKESLIEGMEKG